MIEQITSKLSRPDALRFVKHCALVGQNLDRADLTYKDLRGVNFSNASLRGADLSYADLRGAQFVKADLSRACLYQANCEDADFTSADMTMSYAKGTVFNNARMWFSHMRRVTYKNCFFIGTDLRGADMAGGFFLGSSFNDAKVDAIRNLDGSHRAIFEWWINPKGGPPSYDEKEGYVKVQTSVTGTLSFQENAGKRRIIF